jgi:preprotein translocase subunit YajC
MNRLFTILAAATQPTTQAAPPPFWARLFTDPIWMLVILMLIFYFFMIRSKRNTDRKRQDMLGQLKRGDRIQTIGGILGTVVEARETEVLVKVDESSNTKIRFARSAIHRVIEEEKDKAAAK